MSLSKQKTRTRAWTRSNTMPPNLEDPRLPRNLAMNLLYYPVSGVQVLSRRLRNKTYHEGWSFQAEHHTNWLKFSMATTDHQKWRTLTGMSSLTGKFRASKLVYTEVKEKQASGFWVTLTGKVPSAHDLVIFYSHGGGYVTGSPLMHAVAFQKLLSKLAKLGLSDVSIFALKYPLSPESCFPEAQTTALNAYEWLVQEKGVSASRVVLGGDSAGGNLTLTLLQRIREHPTLKMPRGSFLISPWTDLDTTLPPDATKAQARRDYLPVRNAQRFVDMYLGDSGASIKDPLISPVHLEDMSQFPPTFVSYGGVELFCIQITQWIEKARQCGVPVVKEFDPDMPHVYAFLPDFYGKHSKTATLHLAQWIVALRRGNVQMNGDDIASILNSL